MNRTNVYHALIALAIQSATVAVFFMLSLPLTTGLWVGAVVAVLFYGIREYNQRLVRIDRGEPAWSLDSTRDLVFPLVATVAVAFFGPELIAMLL